ncbi:S26 family signal peptidase [Methylomonas sp. AM2-LC]|uniref:S26 family signal peptidase n=1 Tax=Methylomonas sp. AM2-LC TaxID=3153301 RepID=UPI003267D60E
MSLSIKIRNKNFTPEIFLQEAKIFWPKLRLHFRLNWLVWILIASLYFVVHLNYRLVFNETPSLPYTLFLVRYGENVKTGQVIAFNWHGGKQYPDGIMFAKRLVASQGEVVVRHGRDFSIGDLTLVGKEHGIYTRDLYPNNQLQEGSNVIPIGKYFVAGDHEYSLDSRYSLLGLVDEKDVVGRAYPIW